MKGDYYTSQEVGKKFGITAYLTILKTCKVLKIKPAAEMRAGRGTIFIWHKVEVDAVTPEQLAKAKKTTRSRKGNASTLIPGASGRLVQLEKKVEALEKAVYGSGQKELPLEDAIAHELQGMA